jgi:hypothetical protein
VRNARWMLAGIAAAVVVVAAVSVVLARTLPRDEAPTATTVAAAPRPPATTAPAGPAPARKSASPGYTWALGTWTGTYTCAQGLTNLTLEIEGDSRDELTATFLFEGRPGSGNPSGSYTMRGRLSGAEVVLEPDEWLDQPAGYVMVGLEGRLSEDGTVFNGTVTEEPCTTFTVRRPGV